MFNARQLLNTKLHIFHFCLIDHLGLKRYFYINSIYSSPQIWQLKCIVPDSYSSQGIYEYVFCEDNYCFRDNAKCSLQVSRRGFRTSNCIYCMCHCWVFGCDADDGLVNGLRRKLYANSNDLSLLNFWLAVGQYNFNGCRTIDQNGPLVVLKQRQQLTMSRSCLIWMVTLEKKTKNERKCEMKFLLWLLLICMFWHGYDWSCYVTYRFLFKSKKSHGHSMNYELFQFYCRTNSQYQGY